MLRVLVSGAYGLIGNLVYARLAERTTCMPYGLVRRREHSARVGAMALREVPEERLRFADLADYAAVRRAVDGMDVVVHMAAEVEGRAPWEKVLQSNIIGAYNVFEAGRDAGVKRIVYASSNQVIFGYRNDEPYRSFLAPGQGASAPGAITPMRHDQPTRPMNLYACSKVFGEALAHMYAFAHGMSCLCLRIGWVLPDDRVPVRPLFCSRRDIVQLVERCIDAPASLRYDVFFGHSDNANNLVDIAHARDVLGYEPQDGREVTP